MWGLLDMQVRCMFYEILGILQEWVLKSRRGKSFWRPYLLLIIQHCVKALKG